MQVNKLRKFSKIKKKLFYNYERVHRNLEININYYLNTNIKKKFAKTKIDEKIIFVTSLPHLKNINSENLTRKLLLESLNTFSDEKNIYWIIVKDKNFELEINRLNIEIINVSFPFKKNGIDEKQFIYSDRGAKYFIASQFIKKNFKEAFVMFYDYDDIIDKNILKILTSNSKGYYIKSAKVYDSLTSNYYSLDDFYRFCGSSHILHTSFLFNTINKKIKVYTDSGLIEEKRIKINTNINWELDHNFDFDKIFDSIDNNFLRYILGDHGRKLLDYYRQLGVNFEEIQDCITWRLNHGQNHGGFKTKENDKYLFSKLKLVK